MKKKKATEYLLKIGRGIKTAREFTGLSQKQLAEKIGVKQPRVAEWEKGENEMSKSYSHFIAEALGIDEADLTADEFLFIKNRVRVFVEDKYIFMESPVQCQSDNREIIFDERMHDTANNRKYLIEKAKEIAMLYEQPC